MPDRYGDGVRMEWSPCVDRPASRSRRSGFWGRKMSAKRTSEEARAGERIAAVGFDADDTLWHNETIYQSAQDDLCCLLAGSGTPEAVRATLLEIESRNVPEYGYGIKSFVLSMIETAIRMTGPGLSAAIVDRVLALGKRMLSSPVELLPHAADTVSRLSQRYPLILITKGDLRDQTFKLERSGLARYFAEVEVVSEKSPDTYGQILKRASIDPARFVMVGNSPRSDVLPVLAVGGRAVMVPYPLLWRHEEALIVQEEERCRILADLGELPALLGEWSSAGPPSL